MIITGMPGGGKGRGNAGPPGGDWQLSAGHYYESLPFTAVAYASQTAADTRDRVIYPRPDSDVSSYARHKWAHPSFDYEIPICIRGGAFPYYLEVENADTDAALQGNITITQPWTGSAWDMSRDTFITISAATIAALSTLTDYGVGIRVTDQTGKSVRVWWTFQKEAVAGDHFVFVDPSDAGTNAGTWENPWQSLTQAGQLVDGSTATNEKILVVREGVSQTTPLTGKTESWVSTATTMPDAYIGIPGERPKIDLEGTSSVASEPLTGAQARNDIFVRGFDLVNGSPSASEGRGAFFDGTGSGGGRTVISDCNFESAWFGAASGSTNNCAITFTGISTTRRDCAVVDCTFDTMQSGVQNSSSAFMLMGLDRCLIDNITCSNFNGNSSITYLKHSLSGLTIRRLTGITSTNYTYGFVYSDDTTTSNNLRLDDTEVCFCNVKDSSGQNNRVRYPGNIGTGANGPFYFYRNTVQDGYLDVNSTDIDVTLYGNLSELTDAFVTTGTVTETKSYDAASTPAVAASDFNADGTLTAAALTKYGVARGELGHEIA